MHRALAAALALALCVSLPGCGGVELTAVSAGATVAQSGVALIGRGKAQSFEYATFVASIEAFHRAGDKLCLKLASEKIEEDRARLVFLDDRAEHVIVHIQRRTATVTKLRTDVGLLGSPGLASLLIIKAVEELRAANPETRPLKQD